MSYLIFRTDRIGDYLITAPLIQSIYRNEPNSKVYIVASNKNKKFIKSFKFIEKIFVLESTNLLDRIKLFIQLRKYEFDNIIIADKKNRSIFFGLILKAKLKIFNVSKLSQKKFLDKFYKNVFLDNDNVSSMSIKNVLNENSKSLKFNLLDEDFNYLKKDIFESKFLHNEVLDVNKLDYVLFHYDEKWELENYSKLYKQAFKLTDISTNSTSFLKFINQLSIKTSKKIIITTGFIETVIINEIKSKSRKISQFIYEVNLDNSKAYLIVNDDFLSMSHLISRSKLFISCHGAFTHIASNYQINILDIIEKKQKRHYNRLTEHVKYYKFLYRDNFINLSKEIIFNL